MKGRIILSLALFLFLIIYQANTTDSTPLQATLQIVQYEPLTFQLTFNMPVPTPSFQLMKNDVNKLDYVMLNASNSTQTIFYFSSSGVTNSIDQTNLETYQLIFTYPLNVGNGQLFSEYHILTAQKTNIEISIASGIGIALVMTIYFVSLFTHLSLLMLQFTQMFTLLAWRLSLNSSLKYDLSKYLILSPPIQSNAITQNNQNPTIQSVIMELTLPIGIILVSLMIGVFSKKLLGHIKKTPTQEIIYEFFTFNLFLVSGTIFVFCCFFNSIQWIFYTSNSFDSSTPSSRIAYVLAYLNLVTAVWFSYLQYYKLNPKINQSQQSWRAYKHTASFLLFSKIHEGIAMENWLSRNKHVISLWKRIFLVVCFFFFDGFIYVILVMEFAHLYYIFTVRPFKEQFILNCFIIFRVLFFLLCGITALGQLYFLQGNDILLTYSTVKSFILFVRYFFIGINGLILCTIFYEIYVIYTNSVYQIKLIEDENKFQLKIAKKKRGPISIGNKSDQNIGERGRSNSNYTKKQKKTSPKKKSPEKKSPEKKSPEKKLKLVTIFQNNPIYQSSESNQMKRKQISKKKQMMKKKNNQSNELMEIEMKSEKELEELRERNNSKNTLSSNKTPYKVKKHQRHSMKKVENEPIENNKTKLID